MNASVRNPDVHSSSPPRSLAETSSPKRAALPSSRPRSPGPEPRPSSTWGRDGDTPGHLLHPWWGCAVSVDVASRASIPPQR